MSFPFCILLFNMSTHLVLFTIYAVHLRIPFQGYKPFQNSKFGLQPMSRSLWWRVIIFIYIHWFNVTYSNLQYLQFLFPIFCLSTPVPSVFEGGKKHLPFYPPTTILPHWMVLYVTFNFRFMHASLYIDIYAKPNMFSVFHCIII